MTTTYRWDPPPDVEPEVIEAVGAAQARLLAHERDHQTLNLLGAMDIADALRDRPVSTSCERLEAEANAAGNRILDDLRTVNRGFDAVTKGGTVPAPGANR